jgi:imidazoleglycerol phosphate synthase glutamine amidotransferase subunit HisH
MNTPLEACEEGAYKYFVHSYIAQPEETNVVLSVTRYGDIAFCSSLQRGNLFACQFHPERSGAAGLAIYRALAKRAQLNLSELSEPSERSEEKTIGSKVRAA